MALLLKITNVRILNHQSRIEDYSLLSHISFTKNNVDIIYVQFHENKNQLLKSHCKKNTRLLFRFLFPHCNRSIKS